MKTECQTCKKEIRDDWLIEKCPVCGKIFCRTCGVPGLGRQFCSKPCKEYYVHGEAWDDEEESGGRAARDIPAGRDCWS